VGCSFISISEPENRKMQISCLHDEVQSASFQEDLALQQQILHLLESNTSLNIVSRNQHGVSCTIRARS
jgi:hypothetical protein